MWGQRAAEAASLWENPVGPETAEETTTNKRGEFNFNDFLDGNV